MKHSESRKIYQDPDIMDRRAGMEISMVVLCIPVSPAQFLVGHF